MKGFLHEEKISKIVKESNRVITEMKESGKKNKKKRGWDKEEWSGGKGRVQVNVEEIKKRRRIKKMVCKKGKRRKKK